MIICSHCRHENHGDVTYCVQCGNWLGPVVEKKSRLDALYEKAPVLKKMRQSEIGYVILLMCGIVLLVILSVGMATIEGLASVLLLITGILAFRIFSRKPVASIKKLVQESLVGLLIFASIGVCFDQTGNFIYNKPLEYVLCPPDTRVQRVAVVSNPLPDSTYIIQDYACYGSDGKAVSGISLVAVIVVRFIEYVLLGLIFLCLRWLVWRIRAPGLR